METSNKSGSKSLKTVALKMIMLVMTLLLLVTTLISFAFYIYTYLRSYKHELDILSSYAFANLDHDYLEELFDKTKEIYESIPEEVRKDPFTEAYKGYFGHLLDDKYHEERAELIKCRENSDISNIYLGFYDTEKDRLVIVLDGDKGELYYIPGQYIDNTNGYLEKWERIQKIIKSDWFMSFAHTSLIGFSATDYFAIYTEEGGPLVGLVAIDTNLEYFADELLTYLAMVIPALLIAFGILATIYSRIMDRMVISPVHKLAIAAKAYTDRDMVNESGYTSYFANTPRFTSYELTELRDTMADMEKEIYDSISEIRRVSAEKERMAAEMDIAATIQRSALPKAFPDCPGYDLFATMNPAKEVAGDFYDFFFIDDDHLAMLIADVSGKGVPAALFMMKGKEILRNCAAKGGTPAEILQNANEELAFDNDTSMFITVWLGILTVSTGAVIAANAGHEYPFIMEEDGVFKVYKDKHGLACGAMEGVRYRDYELNIPNGGGLYLYTDGVSEAMNSSKEYFGLDNIEGSLNKYTTSTSKELIEGMKKDVDTFAGDEDQYDDMTMLCIIRSKA
ncbi:MAG: serine/threonine-protein phosphatase [Butyrivibrio sp.]|nr:serine/threonine-protein phosphatase [Butyrivibrio sp.]